MVCNEDCFCRSGYVCKFNKSESPYIRLEKCKIKERVPKCSENEVYQECGSAFPFTCDDFAYTLPKGPKGCIKVYVSGCFCKEGYYRDEGGRCVAPENCCKGDNEQYTDCDSACAETCDSVQLGCIDKCVAGRFCNSSDYVRKGNSTGSPCIQREQCSK